MSGRGIIYVTATAIIPILYLLHQCPDDIKVRE